MNQQRFRTVLFERGGEEGEEEERNSKEATRRKADASNHDSSSRIVNGKRSWISNTNMVSAFFLQMDVYEVPGGAGGEGREGSGRGLEAFKGPA